MIASCASALSWPQAFALVGVVWALVIAFVVDSLMGEDE